MEEDWDGTLTTDQAYLLGVLLGDGHLRFPSRAGTYGTYLSISDENLARYLDMGVTFTLTSWLPWAARGAIAYRDALNSRSK